MANETTSEATIMLRTVGLTIHMYTKNVQHTHPAFLDWYINLLRYSNFTL